MKSRRASPLWIVFLASAFGAAGWWLMDTADPVDLVPLLVVSMLAGAVLIGGFNDWIQGTFAGIAMGLLGGVALWWFPGLGWVVGAVTGAIIGCLAQVMVPKCGGGSW